MYSTLFSSALFAATAVSNVIATFSVNTPPFTQCQDAIISWSPGIPPYYLLVVNPDDQCGDPVLDLGRMSDTSFTWKVSVPSGKSIQLYVEDSGPNDAWGGSVTVSKSDDSSCLSQATRSYYNMTASTPTASSTKPNSHGDTTPSSSPSPSPSSSDTPNGLVPIGAANAGTNPLSSGASSTRAGAPIATIFAAFAAAVALAL